MTEKDEPEDAPAEYDPSNPTPPSQEPPLRSTAPQSPYTGRQVAIGFLILLVGMALTFGVGFLLG